jgi:hypothetical protein
MKKLIVPILVGLSAMTLLTGCAIGCGEKITQVMPTTGQQLMDLQKAKDAGIITDAQYQSEKTKILEHKAK